MGNVRVGVMTKPNINFPRKKHERKLFWKCANEQTLFLNDNMQILEM
jgi:hypothetical protein